MRTPKTWNTWRLASHLQRVAVRAALAELTEGYSTCKKMSELTPAGQAGWLAVARDIQCNTVILGYRGSYYKEAKAK